jgi:hypothetical protein
LDASEPPRIVFEDPASCSDADRIEELLQRAVGPARTLKPGWTITLRVTKNGPKSLRAEGEIRDNLGAHVAGRILYGTGAECAPLARAAGVWAALVIDAESKRPRTAAAEAQGPAPPVAQPADDGASPGGAAGEPWPAPQPEEKLSPEHQTFLHHEDTSRALELGVGTFLMTGTGGGAMTGPSPFLYIETGRGVFLRPSLSFGQTLASLQSGGVSGTWLDSRFDTCARMPGLYTSHQGLQLDLCGGADLGLTLLDGGGLVPYLSLGPALDLRGELGSSLAVALRGSFGLNVQARFDDEGQHYMVPFWSGRVELAFSWSLR